MTDPQKSIALLRRLRTLGVGLALDDFGTGYSSMSYLRQLRFDVLKVDRVFVHDLGKVGGDAIMRAIVAIAHALDTAVTAEGVETVEQLAAVRELGCDAVQGFLLARPQPGSALSASIAATARRSEPELSPLPEPDAPALAAAG